MDMVMSFIKLSDILQMPLSYDPEPSVGLFGSRAAALATSGEGTLPFTLTAEKVFMNEQCGVLVHVMGDLWVLASHYPKTGALGVYLIDANKLEMDGIKTPPTLFISKTFSMLEVYRALSHAIVKAFTRRGNSWEEMRLPT
jgi:hypothetical protein